jgi:RimJ/RimL family protein N-acetyltransferase
MDIAGVSLITERLVLRPMREGDIAATVEGLDDLAVSRMLARVPHPYTEQDAREFLDMLAQGRVDGSVEHFAIAMRDDPRDRLIGAIGLHGAAGAREAEVGYWIARPHWNRGLAREALASVVRHAFFGRATPLSVLTAHAFRTNPASARVLEACGFVELDATVRTRCRATGVDEPSSCHERRREPLDGLDGEVPGTPGEHPRDGR